MIYLIAYSNPESSLPEAVVESAASTIQLDERPIWFVETEAGSSELLNMIWPDGREDESSTGPGVLVPVESYSGYAQARVWDWLKARLR